MTGTIRLRKGFLFAELLSVLAFISISLSVCTLIVYHTIACQNIAIAECKAVSYAANCLEYLSHGYTPKKESLYTVRSLIHSPMRVAKNFKKYQNRIRIIEVWVEWNNEHGKKSMVHLASSMLVP